jgi:hypothetical protein
MKEFKKKLFHVGYLFVSMEADIITDSQNIEN